MDSREELTLVTFNKLNERKQEEPIENSKREYLCNLPGSAGGTFDGAHVIRKSDLIGAEVPAQSGEARGWHRAVPTSEVFTFYYEVRKKRTTTAMPPRILSVISSPLCSMIGESKA